MRKNRTMRLAALLLALTLITSCFVGGTFAKYVTSGTSEDSARVAKFGVEIALAGESMFSNEYDTDDTTAYKGEVSVKSSNADNLVAPGTKSSDTGAVFSITGTPEVATKITVTLDDGNDGAFKDVFLKAGTYLDPTTADKADTFELTEDYYPVKYTLVQTKAAGVVVNKEIVKDGKLEDIKTNLEAFNAAATYAPNTNLGAEFKLTWKWEFGDPTNNKADTLLGNLAAGVNPNYVEKDDKGEVTKEINAVAADAYCLNIDYTLGVTVEQVD